jgi:hypothetical protein
MEVQRSMSGPTPTGRRGPVAAADLAPFVALPLAFVRREYPNKIAHLLHGDGDVAPPRELTPAFYGCFDWHSAVHGHWSLARALRLAPGADFAEPARASLAGSLTSHKLERERRYMAKRPGFERPYGLAWLLALDAELAQLADSEVDGWRRALSPLVDLAATHLTEWLEKLTHPVRTGAHNQTAFSLGLTLDWARVTGNEVVRHLVEERARELFGADRDYPLHLEPSGEDFLSPSLGAADLMRRVLAKDDLAAWLDRVLPRREETLAQLRPVAPRDPADGRLAHLDGLSLSRAFMLEAIIGHLLPGDPSISVVQASAEAHRAAGLRGAASTHYAGAHWLGTFAIYLLTGGSGE